MGISKKMQKILIFLVILGFLLSPSAIWGEEEKQYRTGEFVYINGHNYLLASNSQFIEVLELTERDELVKVSEIYGMDKVNDIAINKEGDEWRLYLSTGNKIIKYNITNPLLPQIEFERNLYEWRRWHNSIGYSRSIAAINDYILTAGSKGTKSLEKSNLFENKIYTGESSYGVTANNSRLAFTTADKGYLYNLSGEIVKEIKIANSESYTRKPVMDYFSNTYFLPDNGIIKVDHRGNVIGSYYNPVEPGVIHSYAASALPNGEVYYVNGYGVSKFDKNFNKTKWLYTAPSNIYGMNSWAVGVTAKTFARGSRIAVFNKSSILLLDDNFNLLDQYTYQPSANADKHIGQVSVRLSQYQGTQNESINAYLYGFWPNEQVQISFAGDMYAVEVDNIGFASIIIKVPGGNQSGIVIVSADGVDSGLNYQATFNIIN